MRNSHIIENGNKLSASQKVELYVKNSILQGSLKPRERIIEEDVARQLGCSRGPVREGLLRLQKDGLIVHIPRLGTYISDVSPEIAEVIFRMRAKLEGLCVLYMRKSMTEGHERELRKRLQNMQAASDRKDVEAFRTADMELHRAIWRLSGREPLFRTLNSLMNPYFHMAARRYCPPMALPEKLRLHREYVEMILTAPMKRLEREVERHLFHRMVALQFDSNGDLSAQNGDWWRDSIVHTS